MSKILELIDNIKNIADNDESKFYSVLYTGNNREDGIDTISEEITNEVINVI